MTLIGRQTLCAAIAQPPQFTFTSTSPFHTTGSYKAPTVATPRATSFRTTSAFRNYSTHRTYTVVPQHIAHRSISSISTNNRSTSSISANYRSYVSHSTAPTYQSSQQRTHSYQGGISGVATSANVTGSTTHYSAGSTHIPTVSTTNLPNSTPSRPTSTSTSTSTKADNSLTSAYLATLQGHSLPQSTTSQPNTPQSTNPTTSTYQPATHLYHTFSALHSSNSTITIPTQNRAVGIDGSGAPEHTWTYNGNTYGNDGDGTFYILFDGKWVKITVQNPGDIGWQYSPVGAPWILLLFLACYAICKYRKQKRLTTNEI
ncbi:MAG: hypothetical protein IKO26_05895 [Paludibacteraceae bacterium]|nr:hypothetical protein [Paludibacteraceae bacterium]